MDNGTQQAGDGVSEFALPGGWVIGSIRPPISCTFQPQPDITAFELASILQYFHGRPMLESDWTALGAMQRHFVRT